MSRHTSNVVTAPLLVALTAIFASMQVAQAGPLNPPAGAVGSTLKTLTEVEPRIAINATNTPGDGDSLYRITQPGSYYLTGNVQGVAGKMGIEVAAANVRIDLNGFALIGVPGSGDGIATSVATATDLTVRDGSITGWGGDGLDTATAGTFRVRLIHVNATSNAGTGLRAYRQSTVEDCIAAGNGGYGFDLYRYSVISRCVSQGNASNGYDCSDSTVLTECASSENLGNGFKISSSSTVSKCEATNNSLNGYSVNGIGAILNLCVASTNSAHGFQVLTATLTNCSANSNTGTGISVIGSGGRYEGNSSTENATGFDISATGNILVRNTSSANPTRNWNVIAGNKCLVVNGVSGGAISGNAGGVSIGSSDPNANFTY